MKNPFLKPLALFVLVQCASGSPVFAQSGGSIINNEYYLRSVRLTQQARDAYEEGDFDASAEYAEEAAEYARLSDGYVAMRLAENALLKAHNRYTWAGSVGAADRYPQEYSEAGDWYNQAQDARQAEAWDDVREAAGQVLALLANVQPPGQQAAPPPAKPETEPPGPAGGVLPAQYTVRLWRNTGDSLSAIAGWSWVYGDVNQWRALYDANRDKLPNPNNPHLIYPGMILDIPSLHGETRRGMYDPAASYER